ncbi:unnamed protein product, partial [Pylaiella littoralis]
MEELVSTPMEPGQNPDDYFNQKHLLRHRAEKMGETVSDRWFKDICVTGFTDDHKDVKMLMYRDPTFDIDQMQSTMRHMFIDEQSRNGSKGRVAGRGIAMTVATSPDIICHICKERGHKKWRCPQLKDAEKDAKESKEKSGGGLGEREGKSGGCSRKWCSVHRTGTHNDDECYEQGGKRPGQALSACTQCAQCSGTKKDNSTQGEEQKSSEDREEFDAGFMFTATRDARTFVPDAEGATLLIDSGATETFLDDQLIPGLKDRM